MELKEIAPLIVPVATAIGTIIPILKASVKWGKKLDMNTMNILRLILHDEHLSMEERLEAGDQYVKHGGNGPTKAYYETLYEEYKRRKAQQHGGGI